jgi:hypothetical protein
MKTDLVIAYIGGGSRGWAWTLMSDLAMEGALRGVVRLYDIDRQAAETNARIGNALLSRPDVVGKWHYEVADDLRAPCAGRFRDRVDSPRYIRRNGLRCACAGAVRNLSVCGVTTGREAC